jgi:transposase
LETDPTRMCELLVGLPEVNVTGVGDWPGWVRIAITTRGPRPVCAGCGGDVHGHGRNDIVLVDLPVFGRAARLVWAKQRWKCPNPNCAIGTWCEVDDRIAPPRAAITDRAGRWATVQVGRHGRSVSEVAKDLSCDWHTIMDAVLYFGAALIDDPHRFGAVDALGLDETLFCRVGRWRTQCWSTQIVDVRRGQLLDVVPGRDAAPSCAWLAARPQQWRDRIRWATLDLSGPYRSVFDTMLPAAVQVADPFHVVKLAGTCVDEVRRRVQNETCGHRGRKDDPLYRARRLLLMADERLDDKGQAKVRGLLDAGDPKGEVRDAWHAYQVVRQIYTINDADTGAAFVARLAADLRDQAGPPEVRRLGRTFTKWQSQIAAWHRSHVSNGPTEAINNLVKRVKRVAFGMTNFRNYRTRSLLYAGKPNWTLLAITPR